MFVYWSDYTVVTLGNRQLRRATAQIAGADGPAIPVTDQRVLVGSTVDIGTPPTGVRFLLEVPQDLDTLVPNAVMTFVNNQLGRSFPFQTYTWRQLFQRLFDRLGSLRFNDIEIVF